ncbi:MAG: acetate kinase [Coriobacteriales bacterium]|jgi:acetate kinase|nr:acetate kinase [Coriobacteriales bacterium]
MYVLVMNTGSSSLKYQLLDSESLAIVDKGLCEKVGSPDSFYSHGLGDAARTDTLPLFDHLAAVRAVLENLLDPSSVALANLEEIIAVGHRVVHGGEAFVKSVVIDEDVIAKIKECVPLAPLHNPAALTGIEACQTLIPAALQVAVFDTAFHQTIPPRAFRYALPDTLYTQHRIRKYGFHGTSHRYVAARAAEILERPLEDLRIITCHLGNGCSLTAVDRGHSVDTSMGFTPLDGVVMGTRCGSIDPAIVVYLITELGMSAEEVDRLMNRESGLLGLTGISNDIRDVHTAVADSDERAELALEIYANAIRRYIGQYAFSMGGVDAIVMTAGVGENDSILRQMVLSGLEGFGIVLDERRNALRGADRVISTDDSSVTLLVIPTNEELLIAKDALALWAARG